MRLQRFKIENKYKNFTNLEIDFSKCDGLSAFIGNNASGKSNLLEALSSIFKSLFLDEKDEFAYFLEYITFTDVNVKITSNKKGRIYAINGTPVFDIKKYLPKRVIAIYSGEEDRLWKGYYKPVYLDYVDSITKNTNLEYPRMLLLNKFYWHITLLSILISDAEDVKDFVENKLGITGVKNIKFKFYKNRYKNYKNSPALSLIRLLDKKENYSLEEFKKVISGDYSASESSADKFFVDYNPTDIFQVFYVAFTPKNHKIIDEIDITFNDGLKLSVLSEGQKKLLLIKAALEFASSEDTLVLLDEPDAHIHIINKPEVIKVVDLYKDKRQIVLTTHSPTLTKSLNNDNVFMLTKGELIDKNKQHIINELTKGCWSRPEQNSFLEIEKDTILVEGKTDIKHLKVALEKLSEVDSLYKQLNLKYLPFNGASGLKLFVDNFPVSKNVNTFAFLDRDKAGSDAIKDTLDFKGNKDEFTGEEKNGIYISYIPKKDGHTKSNFVIEDYYPLEKYKDFLFENVSCVTEVPNHSKSEFKNKFAEKIKEFDTSNFEGFKKLFDLIIKVKKEGKKPKGDGKDNDNTRGNNAAGKKITPTKQLQLEFWTKFIQYTKDNNTSLKIGEKPRPRHWYNISFGTSLARIVLTVNTQKNNITCSVYMPDAIDLFNKFSDNKKAIEDELEFTLDWEELVGKKATRIKKVYKANISEQENWNDYFNWLQNTAQKFSKVFPKYF